MQCFNTTSDDADDGTTTRTVAEVGGIAFGVSVRAADPSTHTHTHARARTHRHTHTRTHRHTRACVCVCIYFRYSVRAADPLTSLPFAV